jgi:hypothetical protein
MAWRLPGLAIALLLGGGAVRAGDPKLAPGRDPGGVAVAVLADGFDTTRPDVAPVLARDGEGEAIAWDAVDGDHQPYARAGAGAGTASLLAAVAAGGVRIVPVRVATGDAASLAKGVAFAQSTPARIVVVDLSDQDRRRLDVLVAAAQRFLAVLFVVSVPGVTAEETKVVDRAANLVLLDSKDNAQAAGRAIAAALGCSRGDLPGTTGAELKRGLLRRLDAPPSAACEPEAAQPQ